MTDKELARQAIALLESSWEYVHSTALNKQIRWFLSAVKSRCQRCGKVSPAEIHTCSPQREWQGLTENEKELLWDEAVDGREHFCSQYGDFADTIEAKLKDKNDN